MDQGGIQTKIICIYCMYVFDLYLCRKHAYTLTRYVYIFEFKEIENTYFERCFCLRKCLNGCQISKRDLILSLFAQNRERSKQLTIELLHRLKRNCSFFFTEIFKDVIDTLRSTLSRFSTQIYRSFGILWESLIQCYRNIQVISFEEQKEWKYQELFCQIIPK